jgi:hypothetical protein
LFSAHYGGQAFDAWVVLQLEMPATKNAPNDLPIALLKHLPQVPESAMPS